MLERKITPFQLLKLDRELVLWTEHDKPEMLMELAGYNPNGYNSDYRTEVYLELFLRVKKKHLQALSVIELLRVLGTVRMRYWRRTNREQRLAMKTPVLRDGNIGYEKMDCAVDVRQAVLRLPEELREVVDMVYHRNYTLGEVASRLNTSLRTVNRRCANLKARLAKLLESYGPDGTSQRRHL